MEKNRGGKNTSKVGTTGRVYCQFHLPFRPLQGPTRIDQSVVLIPDLGRLRVGEFHEKWCGLVFSETFRSSTDLSVVLRADVPLNPSLSKKTGLRGVSLVLTGLSPTERRGGPETESGVRSPGLLHPPTKFTVGTESRGF